MKKLVVLTGAGMSAESGIATFRGADGLWENHRIIDVASPEGWHKNPELVLEFYNQRRKQVIASEPNKGHRILAELESDFDVHIITQNIDDLHERAGSSKILHLHGEIRKVRSTLDPSLIYEMEGWELKKGDKCERGSQLRPHIVWFGEEVPMIEPAAHICAQADLFLIVGTSLQVYPAAGLIHYTPLGIPKYIVDPSIPENVGLDIKAISKGGSEGLTELKEILLRMK
ncbi:MAG: NAD-dependent deacylase [Flavobacteriales bacterium]